MLKEALEFFTGISRESAEAQVIEIDHRKKIVALNGEMTDISVLPRPIKHIASDVSSFVGLLERLRESYESSGRVCDPMVFVDSTDGVLAVMDVVDPRDRLAMHVIASQQLQALQSLSDVSQKKLVSVLRKELFDCYDPSFLGICRRIDFRRGTDSEKVVEHGKESLGRSVHTSVASKDGAIPELVKFAIPMVDPRIGINPTVEIRCAVTLNGETETISVEPVGQEVEKAWATIESRLSSEIASHLQGDVEVVVGSAG